MSVTTTVKLQNNRLPASSTNTYTTGVEPISNESFGLRVLDIFVAGDRFTAVGSIHDTETSCFPVSAVACIVEGQLNTLGVAVLTDNEAQVELNRFIKKQE